MMKVFFGLTVVVSSALFFISASTEFSYAQWLEVNMTEPDTALTLNVIQNGTFYVNVTVYCRDPDQATGCGDVNSTIRYNSSIEQPDTTVSNVQGASPFFINGSTGNPIMCPNNPLNDGDFCNVTWHLNASGSKGTNWRVGALFNTSLWPTVAENHTDNATISITDCVVDFTLHWSSINFGSLSPTTENNSAPGNSENLYNLTLNDGSCPTDFYVRGDDLRNHTFDRNISVGNVSWSNSSSDIDDGFFRMGYLPRLFSFGALPGMNVTTWYWLNTPAVFAGIYNSTIYVTGVTSGSEPPP